VRTGDVAKGLGVSPDLIRRLELRGEIPPILRDRAGQRRYSSADVERIRLILFAPAGNRKPEEPR